MYHYLTEMRRIRPHLFCPDELKNWRHVQMLVLLATWEPQIVLVLAIWEPQ
jgi:hypothetical protein